MHESSRALVVLHQTPKFYVFGLQSDANQGAFITSHKDDESSWCRTVGIQLAAPYSGHQVTLDKLTHGLRVFQLKRGHRFSNDDLFTAWRAAQSFPTAKTLLDLGSGIGSVGLSTLAKMRDPGATLVGIEAQTVSFQMAQASVAFNGLSDRVAYLHGDLRDSAKLLAAHRHTNQAGCGGMDINEELLFDLITGSPPYIPADGCKVSPEPQRAHCRVELPFNALHWILLCYLL